MCNYVNVPQGAAYGFELKDWDNMMPRMMMMGTEFPVKGLKFVGAQASAATATIPRYSAEIRSQKRLSQK